jgi:1,2-diacylglycerol 3-alpha-glucosyltransferase
MGADLARKHGLPMVYTAHSLYDIMIACAKSPLVRKMGPQAVRGYIRRFCARAEYVIAPTRSTRDALRADGVRARFAVVPSGVQPPVIRPEAREETRARLGLAPETPLLLYVGRLGPEKRLDLLIEAADILRSAGLEGAAADFRVAIVGDGQCREELELLTAERGLQARVEFVGVQPHATIGDWYAAGDIFTLPSPAETQGMVLVEAMASGLPCVAVDRGGPRELVLQGETGIRVPPDANALARTLDFLLRNPEVCHRFGEKGRERAADFGPEAMAHSVLALYENARRLPRRPEEKGVQKLTSELRKRRDRIKRVRSRAAARRKL